MSTYRLIHISSRRAVAVVTRAGGWWAKGWGVLGRRSLPAGEGLWLPGVASVHTLGVGFAIDLLFLDRQMQMLRCAPSMPPGRWMVRMSGAAHTLELGAGTLAALALPLEVGDGWRLDLWNDPPPPSVKTNGNAGRAGFV